MKQAIVTGAGSGIGQAIAAALSGEGYRVGILDVSNDAATSAAAAIENAVGLVADVSDETSVANAFDAFGEVPDLVVNNAGLVRFGPLHEQTPDDFRAVVNVNLIGSYIVSREAARRMIPVNKGVIINITSNNGIVPGPNAGAYGATKSAIAMMTQQMAIEWGPLGLRVNAVAPGFIDAGMSKPIYANDAVRKARSGAVPLRRLGTADDIANAVLFLASDKAAYINGHNLLVDGGVTPSLLAQLPRQ